MVQTVYSWDADTHRPIAEAARGMLKPAAKANIVKLLDNEDMASTSVWLDDVRNTKKRGVKIEVILDKSQRPQDYSEADFTAHAGMPTFIDAAHAIAHNNVTLIDGESLITISFNVSNPAEERKAARPPGQDLAIKYDQNWQSHREHSEAYLGR